MIKNGNNYPNPLDNYRTYSYHYIMMAGSSTESLRKILGSVGDGGNALLSTIQSKQLGEEFSLGNDASAYLVLDTRRFSQYFVNSLEMTTMYGSGGSSINPSVPLGAITMQLVDTTGLSFFNFLMDLFRNKLQTSVSSAFFLLSVVFVGHKDDGSTETITMCNMPLLLTKLGFEFKHTGSEFEMEFVDLEGAPQVSAPHQQIQALGDLTTFMTAKNGNGTVGEMLDDLENKLNIQSLRHFQKYVNALTTTGLPNAKPGKLVQYMITVPNDTKTQNNWRDMKINSAIRSSNVERKMLASKLSGSNDISTSPSGEQAKISKGGDSQAAITFSPETKIPDAIKIILESSDEFLLLASKDKREKGEAKSFRLLTSITADDSTYVIHFDIYPYVLPKLEIKEEKSDTDKLKAGNTIKTRIGETSGTQIRNKIEYDYIYTGHNSHITDLKIQYSPDVARSAIDTNVSNGFFRSSVVAAKGGQSLSKVSAESKGAQETVNYSAQIRPGDPIVIPPRTPDQRNNNTAQRNNEAYIAAQAQASFKAKQEYTQTYAMLHFIGTMALEMSIRGNPTLMQKYYNKSARQSIAPHPTIVKDGPNGGNQLLRLARENVALSSFESTVRSGISSAKQQYIQQYVQPRIDTLNKPPEKDTLSGPDVATMPVFVKINIQAPDIDWTGNYKNNEVPFTNTFFFNGYYQLLTLKTVLSGGSFTQQMTLMPYDIDYSYSTSNDKL